LEHGSDIGYSGAKIAYYLLRRNLFGAADFFIILKGAGSREQGAGSKGSKDF
jgi:hypothetical protein